MNRRRRDTRRSMSQEVPDHFRWLYGGLEAVGLSE